MTLGCAVPPARVDGGDDGVALYELSGLDVDAVRPQRLCDLLHIADGRRRRRRGSGDAAFVGDLATGLCVERSAIQYQLDATGLLTVMRHDRDPLAVDENTENSCLG